MSPAKAGAIKCLVYGPMESCRHGGSRRADAVEMPIPDQIDLFEARVGHDPTIGFQVTGMEGQRRVTQGNDVVQARGVHLVISRAVALKLGLQETEVATVERRVAMKRSIVEPEPVPRFVVIVRCQPIGIVARCPASPGTPPS